METQCTVLNADSVYVLRPREVNTPHSSTQRPEASSSKYWEPGRNRTREEDLTGHAEGVEEVPDECPRVVRARVARVVGGVIARASRGAARRRAVLSSERTVARGADRGHCDQITFLVDGAVDLAAGLDSTWFAPRRAVRDVERAVAVEHAVGLAP